MRKRIIMACLSPMLFFVCAARLAAQAVPAGQAPGTARGSELQKGVSARVAFEGSSSSQGQVLDLNTSTGYVFSKHVSVGVGVPFYFVHASTVAPTSGQAPRSSSAGNLGDFYGTMNLSLDNSVAAYSTSLTLTAPTGDSTEGRSTGHMTYDWNNRLDHEFFDRVSPYVEAGLANSISSTRLFKRPYITYGKLVHFEVGTDLTIWKSLTFTVAAYDILPWGQQQVFSRFVRRGSSGTGQPRHRRVFENNALTVGTADLTRDTGYSAGLGFSATPLLDFSVSFSRSVPMHLNTLSFGVGFNLSRMFHRSRPAVTAQQQAAGAQSAQK